MSRPCRVLDPTITVPLIELIREGHFPRTACRAVGVGYSTYVKWLTAGRRKQTPQHEEFLREVKKAQADAEISDLRLLKRDKSWQSCAWRLERRNHKHWGKKDKSQLNITHDQGKPETPTEVAAEIRKVLAEIEGNGKAPESPQIPGYIDERGSLLPPGEYQG